MIFKIIPDLFKCLKYFRSILASKKIVEKRKVKKLPTCMYDEFHAYLVETNLKTQESKCYGRLTTHYTEIFTEEEYSHQ